MVNSCFLSFCSLHAPDGIEESLTAANEKKPELSESPKPVTKTVSISLLLLGSTESMSLPKLLPLYFDESYVWGCGQFILALYHCFLVDLEDLEAIRSSLVF